LLAGVFPIQLSNHEIIERRSCMLASTDPPAGNKVSVSNETVVAVRFKGQVWERLTRLST
jgi:hypothetical protein